MFVFECGVAIVMRKDWNFIDQCCGNRFKSGLHPASIREPIVKKMLGYLQINTCAQSVPCQHNAFGQQEELAFAPQKQEHYMLAWLCALSRISCESRVFIAGLLGCKKNSKGWEVAEAAAARGVSMDILSGQDDEGVGPRDYYRGLIRNVAAG